MKQLIDIKVLFNKNEIISQLFDLGSDDFNDLMVENDSKFDKFKQIVIKCQFCQTIRFIDELNSSLIYRQKVFNRLNTHLTKESVISNRSQLKLLDQINDNSDEIINKSEIIQILIKLKSMDHSLAIDKNWNYRILKFVVIRFRVEDSLSWLSTLGGAYSSLGEYDINCAAKAGQISISQLGLAAITGDPNITAKCGIYMAYSLCQQQRRGQAIKLIKKVIHPFISKIKNCDKIVFSMYSALCYRIQTFDKKNKY